MVLNPKKLLAATQYTIAPIKPLPVGKTSTNQIEDTISMIIGFLTVVGIIYFAIQVILAGYSFLSSQGDKSKLEESRKKLTNSILGLTIIVVAMGLSALLAGLLGLDNIFDLNQVLNKITGKPPIPLPLIIK